MITYRPFLNSDPPYLVDIWRTQAHERGLMQPMSVDLLEQLVLAKPYFEREGFIVAVDGERPIGFIHAAFGPQDDETRISTDLGVICMVMVRADYQHKGVGKALIAEVEAYLRRRGAKVLYAGGIKPLNGFYLGLYGGSEMPGVLASTPKIHKLFQSQGYREIDRVSILHCNVSGFAAPVDRRQVMVRRSSALDVTHDPKLRSWWEACTYGIFDRLRFDLHSRDGRSTLGSATFWDIQPLGSSWGVRAAGLIDLEVPEQGRRRGLGTCLLCEAMRELNAHGINLVEAQTMVHNTAAVQLYQKLGFKEVDQGVVYRKE